MIRDSLFVKVSLLMQRLFFYGGFAQAELKRTFRGINRRGKLTFVTLKQGIDSGELPASGELPIG